MVKALKGDEIKGYFSARIGDRVIRFNQSNVGDFVKRIPVALAKILALDLEAPATLVPIPNSHVTAEVVDFPTLDLARKVARTCSVKLEAVPALVFVEPQPKSRTGGPRSASHFESVYRVVKQVQGPIVLIDDVCTSGGHLIGAYRKLHSSPTREVILACAWGRSTDEQVNTPLGPREEFLDVSDPFDF